MKKKVEKLLSDTRFLLFLKVDDLRISFWDENEEILSLAKKQSNDVLTLFKNGITQNHWLITSKEVNLNLFPEVKEALVHDSKTPTKLKDSDSLEISFAIALNNENSIVPLVNAVMYTYLPTSFSFGLKFIVNANFITDAGRQQIVKDCVWNEFIFSQIPGLFLNWSATDVAKYHSDWYKVLPHTFESDENLDDELSRKYYTSLKEALDTIPFVKAVDGELIQLKKALFDRVELNTAIPARNYNDFVQTEIYKKTLSYSLVSKEVGQALLEAYDVKCVKNDHVQIFLEKSIDYLTDFTDENFITLLNWLRNFSVNQKNDFKDMVSGMSILPANDSHLIEPANSFFPSMYSEENPEISKDAKIISKSLMGNCSNEIVKWLNELGVKEMSNLAVIEKVLCDDNYINKDNALEILRFIFECNKKENVFANISESRLAKIKILTTNGVLKYASELYLSNVYNPICKIQETYMEDIFVSEKYPGNSRENTEWSLFFKKLGCNDDIKLSLVKYGDDSWVMKDQVMNNCIRIARNSVYNTAWNGSRYYLGRNGKISINVMSSPMLSICPTRQMHEFYIQFWSRILTSSIPEKKADYIQGCTGHHSYYGDYYAKAYLGDSSYLNKSFIEWVIEIQNILPATDGEFYNVGNLLINSHSNKETFGSYYPVLAIDEPLGNEWVESLQFKNELSLSEYLEVLDRMSKIDTKDEIIANKERLNRIYEHISDSFDFSKENSNFSLVQNWGKDHKILSKEGLFKYPKSLYLLSSRLLGVELEHQVFHGRHLDNERFASFAKAVGVNMITDYRVEGLNNAVLDLSIIDKFICIEDFLTCIAIADSCAEQTWKESKSKMHNAILSLEFYTSESISIFYGSQEFPKSAYSTDKRFYYVNKLGMANLELLHNAIMDALNIPKKQEHCS